MSDPYTAIANASIGIEILEAENSHCIQKILTKLNFSRPFFVTSKSLFRYVECEASGNSDVSPRIFADVRPHVPIETVVAASEDFISHGADCIVAVGGGSTIDTAKLILYESVINPGAIRERRYAEATKDGVDDEEILVPRLVTMATTLSQAEYTAVAGLSVPGEGKIVVKHPRILPSYVVQNADLCMGTPAQIWAASAVKAIDSAIQCLAGIAKDTSFSGSMTTVGMSALYSSLQCIQRSGRTPELTSVMQAGALLSLQGMRNTDFDPALSMSRWPGALLRHQLGAHWNLPHSDISAFLLGPLINWIERNDQVLYGRCRLAFNGDDPREAVGMLQGLVGGEALLPIRVRLRELDADVEKLLMKSLQSESQGVLNHGELTKLVHVVKAYAAL